jgi:YesN/AraC family two-component response regulator
VSEAISSQKYGNTAMKEDELTLIQQKLEALMTTEKTYIDRELNLNKLSEIIGISSHQLSQCINRIYDKNFYDYINFHRVNEAKQLMQNSQYENFKIEVIGEKAGFNSRTTFFSVFKKITGESPSAFKKNSSTF